MLAWEEKCDAKNGTFEAEEGVERSGTILDAAVPRSSRCCTCQAIHIWIVLPVAPLFLHLHILTVSVV